MFVRLSFCEWPRRDCVSAGGALPRWALVRPQRFLTQFGAGRAQKSALDQGFPGEIGEILFEGVLLPVTIRGEVPGRAMRGSANLKRSRRCPPGLERRVRPWPWASWSS
ncbi:hypothetical protein EOD08_22090 [Mesorhizobium sp. M6A.T.Ca.TU.002.02.2.1]|nr:hypothetical protein EOD08_22090 [Mesorhizobium sp. M6A.T.Ca.TU.002.02.2.1]